MRVALVSSDGRCGIAEHSNMLVQSVQAADPGVEFVRDAAWLNPDNFHARADEYDVLHLNYHRGLHSQWTPGRLNNCASKVVITFHDTYDVQPDRLPWELCDIADAFIVHEPCDLEKHGNVYYWRQGVPEPSDPEHGATRNYGHPFYPVVGTCGFAFPWKGFELLCDAANSVGWGVRILSHNATDEQVADWKARNPRVWVSREYLTTDQLISQLLHCDATAFLYSCANSGTSGAIRLGIAAGKPLLATHGCRQFRDLEDIDCESPAWVDTTVQNVADTLENLLLQRFDPIIVALRERDSWRHLGKRYATLYRSLVP